MAALAGKRVAGSNASVRRNLRTFMVVPAPWLSVERIGEFYRNPSSHLEMRVGRKKPMGYLCVPLGVSG
jgi:hypothetical protein